MQNKLAIAYFPFDSDNNSYVLAMRRALSEICDVHPIPKVTEIVASPFAFFRKYDVVILNWIDNSICNRRGRVSVLGICFYLAKIIFGFFIAKKVIFIRHNNYPHACRPRSARLARILVDISERLFSVCVTHSGAEVTRRRFYVPHPLYFESLTPAGKARPGNYYVVFGRIERYKRIEELIRIFPPDACLIIAGPCHDSDYLNELQELAVGKKIEITARYLMEETAAELLINSRGLFLPHSGDDMVVSGSYFFAASLGVPVIARRNPFLGWLSSLPSAKGIFFYQSRRDIEGFYKMGTDATSSEEILAFANAEFGKRKIELCWRMVFNSIDIKC